MRPALRCQPYLVWLLLLSLLAPLWAGGAVQRAAAAPALAMTGLHVVGNQLVNGQGQAVRLRGVNRSGLEFACVQGWGLFNGPNDAASVAAMAAWGITAVRLPLNEQCWLGINGVKPAYSGANYQRAIADYVALLNAQGLAVILDLHWAAPGTTVADQQTPMADRDHAPLFWSQVAAAYKGNSAVLFDLFNEPYPDNNRDTAEAWRCWRDGGTCAGVGYQAAGMQELVSAVRGTGAQNVILLGGVAYASHLSQWLTYRPTDPVGNLLASWHIYAGSQCNTLACWEAEGAPVVAQVPLVAGEFGQGDCGRTFVDTLLDWHDTHGAGYLGWTWNTWGCSGPSLITDYAGTPTALGQSLRDHLAQGEPVFSLSSSGGGTAQSSRLPGAYPSNTVITATAQPAPGNLFVGWLLDGVLRSYQPTVQIQLDTSHLLVATFAPQRQFPDVGASDRGVLAIEQLAARGIIKGYPDGRFGPDNQIARVEAAALLVRLSGWGGDPPNPFSDRNDVGDELWRDVAILVQHDVVHGYGDGRFGTRDPVSQAQVISLITRLLVQQGCWQPAANDAGTIYPNIAPLNAHRSDLVTYVQNAGAVPDNPDRNGAFGQWDQPASRRWFAQALWAAQVSCYQRSTLP